MHLRASAFRQLSFAVAALTHLSLAVARPTHANEKAPAAGEFFGTFEAHYLSNLGEKTRWGELTTFSTFLASDTNFNILPKWGGGGRVGLGYRAAAGWDVVALGDADWLYSSQQQALVNNPQIGFNKILFDRLALAFPGFLNGQVSADAQTAYSYVDLEGGYTLKLGTMFDARLFGGVRYANFDQGIETEGLEEGAAQIDTRREITYWGVGPRLGGSSRVRICESPFYLVTSVSGSVLFGDMRVRDRETVSFGGSPNAFDGQRTMYTARTTYNGEGEAGILYDISPILQGLDVTVGYRVAGWFGVNDTRSVSNFPSASGESHANVVTQATFLRLSVRY